MKVFLITITLLLCNALNTNNDSFALYEVYPINYEQARQLELFGKFCHVIFLDPVHFGDLMNVKVLVPNNIVQVFGDFLMCRQMEFSVEFDQNLLEIPTPEIDEHTVEANITFEKYNGLNVIYSYLESLYKKYPKIVTLEKYGKSSKGQDLTVVKISSNGDHNNSKPLIFIDAGIHGNEFIAPAQALYIIQQLVENVENWYLISDVDWIIFPVVNPDGYDFSFTNNLNFRKTGSKGKYCIGVDANRNFDFYWGNTYRDITNECSITYPGPQPFSEPESRAVRDIILKYSHRIKLYLSFHSASQVILYPWGYTTKPPLNADELKYLATLAASVIESISGTQYRVGQISRLMYKAFGDSISWAKGIGGIDLSFVIELPPENPHTELPLKCIKFVVLEIFEAIKIFHNYIKSNYSIM